jgi:hypothetical protein
MNHSKAPQEEGAGEEEKGKKEQQQEPGVLPVPAGRSGIL